MTFMTRANDQTEPLASKQGQAMPIARLYGVPLEKIPEGLYIPPDAMKLFLESFEGPLDLLLFLIRKQRFNVMDVPMALLTEQYMAYVDLIRAHNLDLAGEYLVMAAYLMSIKSRLLLPVRKSDTGEEVEDPKAELMRRLAEYEKMKFAAARLDAMPICGRDFTEVDIQLEEHEEPLPDASLFLLHEAWLSVLERLSLKENHSITREELSIREYMSRTLRRLQSDSCLNFMALIEASQDRSEALAYYLAILELAKEQLVRIVQAAPFAPIWLMQKTLPDELL